MADAGLSGPDLREIPARGTYPWEAPLGAVPKASGTEFRVWAPAREAVAVAVGPDEEPIELREAGLGIWAGWAPVGPGTDYRYLLRGGEGREEVRVPDPCSRHQPRGLRGPSRVFDPGAHAWSDQGFRPAALSQSVIYELHVGTFTPEGTLAAAAADLPRLRELGVTTVELMPLAEGPGERGWGYDGVYISAVHHAYGGPRALQEFVEAAHALGIGVLLDVVYNHVGASGTEAMEALGPYFTDHYRTFWGKAMNYDSELCDPVREWVLQSAEGWIRDFHIDGLRLDAIHAIYDQSALPIVAAIVERVHEVDPLALVIAESGLNDPRVIRPLAEGGLGCDGQWADDFHHALRVLLTGEREGYYEEFGRVGELAKAFVRPFVHDGQYSTFRRRRFGAPAPDRPPEQFVVFCQNHDQVGNRAIGDRLPARVRRLAAFCMLLSPFTPMLFMGEEYGEEAPFLFFTDHIDPEIARATREGRRREFQSFGGFAGEVPDPQDPETFRRSKLTRERDSGLEDLYAELIRLRRRLRGTVTEVHSEERARWLRVVRGEYVMICNFGPETRTIPTDRGELVVATHPVELNADGVLLPGLAGSLLR